MKEFMKKIDETKRGVVDLTGVRHDPEVDISPIYGRYF